jgi:hypothetical protein
MHTGAPQLSFAGAQGHYIALRREDAEGTFRPFLGFEVDFFNTPLTVGSSGELSRVDNLSLKGSAGMTLVLFKGNFQPFLSGSASFSRTELRMSPSTIEIPNSTLAYLYGWEASVGVDLFGGSQGSGFRLRARTAISSEYGRVGSIQSFRSNTFKLGGGLCF